MKTIFLYTYDEDYTAFTDKGIAIQYAVQKTREENEIEDGEYTDKEIIDDYNIMDDIIAIPVVSKLEELKAAKEMKEREELEARYQSFLDSLDEKERRTLNLPKRVKA